MTPADPATAGPGGLHRRPPRTDPRAGYEISHGENHPGVNGISAALLADDGTALGSVTVAGPDTRMTDASLLRLAPVLGGACRELAPRLANLLGPNPGTTVAALDL